MARTQPHALARDGGTGVWLDADEEAEEIGEDVAKFQVIALNFPAFTDGRNYSNARLLRDRYGFKGELRAIGDVLRDQLFYMHRCGFDAFAIRADKDPYEALEGLKDFSVTYQLPLTNHCRCSVAAKRRTFVANTKTPVM